MYSKTLRSCLCKCSSPRRTCVTGSENLMQFLNREQIIHNDPLISSLTCLYVVLLHVSLFGYNLAATMFPDHSVVFVFSPIDVIAVNDQIKPPTRCEYETMRWHISQKQSLYNSAGLKVGDHL